MMKHTQTIFTKISSSFQHRWKEQDGLVLGVVFIGGFFGHALMNTYKKIQHYYRVDRMLEESYVRSGELFDRRIQYGRALMEEIRANHKPLVSDPEPGARIQDI